MKKWHSQSFAYNADIKDFLNELNCHDVKPDEIKVVGKAFGDFAVVYYYSEQDIPIVKSK